MFCYNTSRNITLHYKIFHCITLYYITLHYGTVRYITLFYVIYHKVNTLQSQVQLCGDLNGQYVV